jgi:hypothetical protein
MQQHKQWQKLEWGVKVQSTKLCFSNNDKAATAHAAKQQPQLAPTCWIEFEPVSGMHREMMNKMKTRHAAS